MISETISALCVVLYAVDMRYEQGFGECSDSDLRIPTEHLVLRVVPASSIPMFGVCVPPSTVSLEIVKTENKGAQARKGATDMLPCAHVHRQCEIVLYCNFRGICIHAEAATAPRWNAHS